MLGACAWHEIAKMHYSLEHLVEKQFTITNLLVLNDTPVSRRIRRRYNVLVCDLRYDLAAILCDLNSHPRDIM